MLRASSWAGRGPGLSESSAIRIRNCTAKSGPVGDFVPEAVRRSRDKPGRRDPEGPSTFGVKDRPSSCGPAPGNGFGVGQLVLASSVAVFGDEVAGPGKLALVAGEAGAVEVDVGEDQRHRAALGDLLGLV